MRSLSSVCSVQYYFSPSGRKFRSRQEVMRSLGLEPDARRSKGSKPAKPVRAEVFQAAREAHPDPASCLPLQLDSGVSVTR